MWLLVAAVLLLLFIWVFGEISDRMPRRRHKKTACGKKIIAFLRRGLHWRGSKTGGAPAACSILRFMLS